MPKSAQRQFLVRVNGIEGYFATKSGGSTAANVSDVWDGGSLTPEKLASPATTENITISRPYDVARDQSVIKRMRPMVGRLRTTVSVQPTDADLVAVGPADVYANALLVSVSAPEADAASGDPGLIELVFAVESVA